MMLIDNFIGLFTNPNDFAFKETFTEFHSKFETSIISLPTKEEFENYKRFLSKRDSLHIGLKIGESDSIDYYSKSNEYELFSNQCLNRLNIKEDDEKINFTLTITKKINGKYLSVYNLESFVNFLNELHIDTLLTTLYGYWILNELLFFEVLHGEVRVKTTSLIFNSNIRDDLPPKKIKRDERINSSKSICNSNLISSLTFLPDDFHVLDSNNDSLTSLLKKIETIYLISFLFDIVTLTNSNLEFKLNGYKSIKEKLDVNNINLGSENEYYSVYEWCYEGGNLNDKIGLVRNIISLHFAESGKLELKGNPFQSIQSSYKVYEKQNIKQYIEIRNKISDQLLDFNNRANKVIETFATGFQKSALALITFYFSSIAIKVFGKGNFVNVFTLDTTVLSIVFLTGSLIYYFVAKWEVKEQRKRFVASYTNLKERYTDLLEKDDIQRILNNDKEFNADVKFIDDKLKNYSNLWLWFLGILLLGTLFLFFTYNLSQLFDTLIWRLLFKSICKC